MVRLAGSLSYRQFCLLALGNDSIRTSLNQSNPSKVAKAAPLHLSLLNEIFELYQGPIIDLGTAGLMRPVVELGWGRGLRPLAAARSVAPRHGRGQESRTAHRWSQWLGENGQGLLPRRTANRRLLPRPRTSRGSLETALGEDRPIDLPNGLKTMVALVALRNKAFASRRAAHQRRAESQKAR
jgi:hypothetical protein